MPIKFTNQADNTVEISIYDVIGFWGTTAQYFRDQMKAAKGKDIVLVVNSPGGSIIDGNAIMTMLNNHDGQINARIEGLAASMATQIVMAADHITMAENAWFMIHNPSGGVEGEASDMRKYADILEKMKAQAISAYAKKTGLSEEKIGKLMDEETWMTAQEAKDLGFVDTIGDSVAVEAAAQMCDAHYPNKKINFTAGAKSVPGGQTQPNESNMKPEEIQALQNKVTSLEAEQAKHSEAIAAAKSTATQEATNAAKTAEKTRKDGIQAIVAKYNKDGDLNNLAVAALAGDVTVEAFKDQVLEAVNARPTRAALKTNNVEAQEKSEDADETVEGDSPEMAKFRKDYANATDTKTRMALVRANPVLARKLANS